MAQPNREGWKTPRISPTYDVVMKVSSLKRPLFTSWWTTSLPLGFSSIRSTRAPNLFLFTPIEKPLPVPSLFSQASQPSLSNHQVLKMLFRNYHNRLIIPTLTFLLLAFLPNISAHPLTSSGFNDTTLNTTDNATKWISTEHTVTGCNSDGDCELRMFNFRILRFADPCSRQVSVAASPRSPNGMRCIGRVSAATGAVVLTKVQVREVIEQRDGMSKGEEGKER